MPGVFGVIATNRQRNPNAVFNRMQQLLKHREFYRGCSQRAHHRAVGAWSTNPWFSADNRLARHDQITLLVEGTAFVIEGKPVADDDSQLAQNILDLYLRHGDEFIHRVGGHFNLVLIDDARDQVQLFNDRTGFAHMYWYADRDVFMFGPELKAFFAWEDFNRSVDEGSLAMVLAKECPYGRRTLFSHVSMLEPATRLVYSAGKVSVSNYWRPQPAPTEARSADETIEQALVLYARALAKRIPTSWRGRVLLPLTGGLDSRLLLWLMRNTNAQLEAYTHGQPDCTDFLIARQLVAAQGRSAQHRLVPMNPDWAATRARDAVWLNDGQLNMRNATLLGVSDAVGAAPVPFLNGIIGQHMSLGVGSFVKPHELVPIRDEARLRQKVLEFSGAASGVDNFELYMNPHRVAAMTAACHEHAWQAFQPLRHIELFGDQKVIFINRTMGARMQGTVDVHKYEFHDLLPFVDEELMQFWLTSPLHMRLGHTLYKQMYRKHIPELARIPWAETGKNLLVSEAEAEASLQKRMRKMALNEKITSLSRGLINPRNRDAYAHRETWMRRNSAFHGLIRDTLANVNRGGCDYFDQTRVNTLFKRFLQGHNYLFKPTLQVASVLLWHEMFVQNPPAGARLDADPGIKTG